MVVAAADKDIFTFLNWQCNLAVAADFKIVAAVREAQTDGAATIDNQRAGREGVREHWHQRNGIQRGRQDRTASGKGIGGRTGRCGNDQPVRTLREGKDFVDIDFELNHMRDFARMQDHFIDGRTNPFLTVLLADLRFEQKTFFTDVMPIQDIGQLLMSVIRVEVGQEAEIATVDTDDFNVVTRQRAGSAEHVAVAADHDREISLLSDLSQCAGLHIFELQFLRNLLFNHHFITFRAQPAIQHFMCRQRGRVTWMSDNPNTLEMIIHFLEVLVPNDGDNMLCSLESRKLIPIISEVSEMNAEKTRRNS
ncbi:hypothetical protein D3C87_1342150 [compost metagenome]